QRQKVVMWAHLYADGFGAAVILHHPHEYRGPWVLAITHDDGRHWRNITPSRAAKGPNDFEPFFLNPSDVWIATVDCARGTGYVFRSGNGGRSWERDPGQMASCGEGRVVPDFVDPTHGWLSVLQPTGPDAALLHTNDGGT